MSAVKYNLIFYTSVEYLSKEVFISVISRIPNVAESSRNYTGVIMLWFVQFLLSLLNGFYFEFS